MLFAAKGYESTSMNDIARAVSLSKATLYHYFSSKDSIFDEIILTTLQSLMDHVRQKLDTSLRPALKLEKLMQIHADFFEDNLQSFTAMLIGFGGMKDVHQRSIAVKLRDEYETLLRSIIRDGVDSGEFRSVDPTNAARAILSMLNWMARWYKPDGKLRAADIAKGYADLALNGLIR